MKFWIWAVTTLVCSCGPSPFALAQKYVEQQAGPFTNHLRNPGFEQGIGPHVYDAGTPTLVAPGREGSYAVKNTFASVNGSLQRYYHGTCGDMQGENMLMSFYFKTTTANIQLCSMNGSTEVQCKDVPATGEWTEVFSTMTAGSSSCGYKIKTTTSTSGDYTVDVGYIGKNWRVGEINSKSFSYTPSITTASGTMTNYTTYGDVTIVGDRVRVTGALVFTGSPGTWSDVSIAVPSDYPISVPVTTTAWILGQARIRIGAGTVYHGSIFYNNTFTSVFLKLSAIDTHTGTPGIKTYYTVSQASPSTWANGDYFTFTIEYKTSRPISLPATLNQAVDLLGTIVLKERGDCPAGTVEANGGTIPAHYPDLIAYIGSSTMPDYRGLYARNIGTSTIDGRNKVGPTNPGDKQEDRFQGHWHSIRAPSTAGSSSLWGFMLWNTNRATNTANTLSPGEDAVGSPTTDGTNGTPRVGAETQVSGYGVRPCMVAVRGSAQMVAGGVIYSPSVQAGGERGVTSIESGTYSATITGVTNVSSVTSPVTCRYTRVGKIVSGGCRVTIVCTSAASNPTTTFRISLPVPSNFTTDYEGSGTLGNFINGVGAESGFVFSNSAEDMLEARFNCITTSSSIPRALEFTYEIK